MAARLKFSDVDIQEMIELYSRYRFSCKLIGCIFNCKNHVIWRLMKKVGVRIDQRVVTKEIEGINHSTCATCQILKPFDMFRTRKLSRNGIDSSCKECVREYERVARLKNGIRYRERGHNWVLNNKEKVIESNRKQRSKEGSKEKQSIFKKEWIKKNYAYVQHTNRLREADKLQALPTWADKEKIAKIYQESTELNKNSSQQYHVDHIVPLRSGLVCGLHCEFNLQIITKEENLAKGNRYWTDMPD